MRSPGAARNWMGRRVTPAGAAGPSSSGTNNHEGRAGPGDVVPVGIVPADMGGVRPIPAPCEVCGVEGGDTGADEMSAVLRMLPERYRALVGPSGVDIAIRQHPQGSWSALECTVHVTDVLERSGLLLDRTLAGQSTVTVSVDIEAPRASANAADWQATLDSLQKASLRLTCIIDSCSPQDWQRVAARGQRQITAAELVWETVHEGVHHLVEAQRALKNSV